MPELASVKLRYSCARERLPSALAERFIELELDAGTRAYLEGLRQLRHGRIRTLLHRSLRQLFSDFDVNGLLGMYPMHLLSTEQWRSLLGPTRIPRLLDIGAGSGDVTLTLQPLCDEVRATEMSSVMARTLRRRGIPCERIDVASTELPHSAFELITCLNVLDRCAYPRTLLRHVRNALTPGGRLVVALALPYSPFFYDGPHTPAPKERLACEYDEWETAVEALVERELKPLGFELSALARAPYLSGGDVSRAVYELDDVVVVCKVPG